MVHKLAVSILAQRSSKRARRRWFRAACGARACRSAVGLSRLPSTTRISTTTTTSTSRRSVPSACPRAPIAPTWCRCSTTRIGASVAASCYDTTVIPTRFVRSPFFFYPFYYQPSIICESATAVLYAKVRFSIRLVEADEKSLGSGTVMNCARR